MRVYVHQTNTMIMFVCLFYFCHIHNQFDHHLHTYTREINFLFHLRSRSIINIDVIRNIHSIVIKWKYEGDFSSFVQKHVDHYWHKLIVVTTAGHWHLLEDHYDTHVKQHASIQKKTRYKRAKFFSFSDYYYWWIVDSTQWYYSICSSLFSFVSSKHSFRLTYFLIDVNWISKRKNERNI